MQGTPLAASPTSTDADVTSRLRQIRDSQRAAAALTAERDWLVRQALCEGRDEREIGRAAGISRHRVRELGSLIPGRAG